MLVTQTLQEDSLAWFLAESGYHVWLLDLRGKRQRSLGPLMNGPPEEIDLVKGEK
jgi:predicted alpha/beta hydrolase